MARTLRSDLAGLRRRLAELATNLAPAVAAAWARSLLLRVVALTMLLSAIVLALVGTYIHSKVAEGLTENKVDLSLRDAVPLAKGLQNQIDGTSQNAARDTAERALASARAVDGSREVVFMKGITNGAGTVVPTQSTGDVDPAIITEELRRQLADSPGRQAYQIVTLDREGQRVPAVVVGSSITMPSGVGRYEFYAVYPMAAQAISLRIVDNNLLAAGAVTLLLLGGIAYIVTRVVVTPVRRAAQVAERLASGSLDQRMPVHGTDDIAVLGRSFNRMANSLQTQIVQLKNLSALQQQFVSDVSHELRTPLTTVRMAADVLTAQKDDFPPVAMRTTELLDGELTRFETLLADLLEISRYDAGASIVETEPIDLVALTEQVVADADLLAQRRGSVVQVRAASAPVVVDLDARRIARILRNLVVNAIEHGEGRPILIEIASNDLAAAVAVRDQGIGLEPGQAALVFTRFWRADPSRVRTTGGTGLGLSIALEDAHIHGGWLEAWGRPGVGSTFRLTLPIRAGELITESPLSMQPEGVEPEPVELPMVPLTVGEEVPGAALPGTSTVDADPAGLRERAQGVASRVARNVSKVVRR